MLNQGFVNIFKLGQKEIDHRKDFLGRGHKLLQSFLTAGESDWFAPPFHSFLFFFLFSFFSLWITRPISKQFL